MVKIKDMQFKSLKSLHLAKLVAGIVERLL
jgi:hypothetical protein